MPTPTAARLAEVLGADYTIFAFPTAAAATDHACRRMDEGRPAVTYTDADGHHIAAWGVIAA